MGVHERSELEEAVQAMQAAGVRRLLVHDDKGHLVGLLSFDDLLPLLLAPLIGLASVLRRGAEREKANRGALAAAVRPVLRVPRDGHRRLAGSTGSRASHNGRPSAAGKVATAGSPAPQAAHQPFSTPARPRGQKSKKPARFFIWAGFASGLECS